jgi:putative oxidoreductase
MAKKKSKKSQSSKKSKSSKSSKSCCGCEAWGYLSLRLAIAIVFIVHGAQKLFIMGIGGFGGFLGTLGVPMPEVAAALIAGIEFIGGIFILLGFSTRWSAWALSAIMAGAILLVHGANGFMASNNGYEFQLTLLLACVALALLGPGKYSLDAKLCCAGK